MSNKKELNVNELSKVSGGVTTGEISFKYKIGDRVIQVFSNLSSIKPEIKAQGGETKIGCSITAIGRCNEGNCYFIVPLRKKDYESFGKAWTTESSIDNKQPCKQPEGVTLIDGSIY